MPQREDKNNEIIGIVVAVLGGIFVVWLFFWSQQRHSQGNLARQLLNKQRNVAIAKSMNTVPLLPNNKILSNSK